MGGGAFAAVQGFFRSLDEPQQAPAYGGYYLRGNRRQRSSRHRYTGVCSSDAQAGTAAERVALFSIYYFLFSIYLWISEEMRMAVPHFSPF